MQVHATYISDWDDTLVESGCVVNTETGVVEPEVVDQAPDGPLIKEYVELGDSTFNILTEDDEGFVDDNQYRVSLMDALKIQKIAQAA